MRNRCDWKELALILCDSAEKGGTYERQLGNDNAQSGQEVDGEVGQVVVGVVSAEEEEQDGHTE